MTHFLETEIESWMLKDVPVTAKIEYTAEIEFSEYGRKYFTVDLEKVTFWELGKEKKDMDTKVWHALMNICYDRALEHYRKQEAA